MTLDVNEVSEVVSLWLATEGLGLLKNFIVFLLVIVAGYIAAKVGRRAVATALERSHLQPSPLARQFSVNVTSKAIWLVALVIALGNLGIDTSALVAGIGVSGLVLGFALKDTLSNFASGMLILLYRPFDVDDFVEISGIVGKVKDLTLVSTILNTPDNKVVTLPNSGVWGNSITNFSASGTRRIDLVIGVAYNTDIDEARRVFLDLLYDNEDVLDDPEPVVMMAELNNSSIDFHVRGWCETANFFPTRSELLRQIKYELDGAEIGIPFPQREVWMHQMAQTDEAQDQEVDAPKKSRQIAEGAEIS